MLGSRIICKKGGEMKVKEREARLDNGDESQ